MRVRLLPSTDVLGLGDRTGKIFDEHTGEVFGYTTHQDGEYIIYFNKPLPLETVRAVVNDLSVLDPQSIPDTQQAIGLGKRCSRRPKNRPKPTGM